jgi:hypothetical protein
MSLDKSIRVLVLTILVGVLVSTFGFVGTASASIKLENEGWFFPVSGGGSAGPGSLAVAAFFNLRDSSGAGAFSGVIGGVVASGLFTLNVTSPAKAPLLPCPMGEMSAGGTVVTSSMPHLQGDQVIIAGCIGSGVSGAFLSGTAELPGNDFSATGTGTGTATVASMPRLQGDVVAAGVTSGSGSAGPGTIYTAEAGGVTKDGSLFGGGALVGSVSDINSGSVWQINKVSSQTGCALTSSGVTGSFGSFPNQPVSSSYTLVTCPPANLGPQTSRFVYLVGGDANPIYKGTGSATITTVQTRGSTF